MYMVNDDENAKERPVTDSEQALLVAGLRLLRIDKALAFESITAAYAELAPTMQFFIPADFGIPEIDALIAFIEGEG